MIVGSRQFAREYVGAYDRERGANLADRRRAPCCIAGQRGTTARPALHLHLTQHLQPIEDARRLPPGVSERLPEPRLGLIRGPVPGAPRLVLEHQHARVVPYWSSRRNTTRPPGALYQRESVPSLSLPGMVK